MTDPDVRALHLNALSRLAEGLRTAVLAHPHFYFATYPPKTEPKNLLFMVETIIDPPDDWTADKAHRWFAFVQGVLAARGLLSVGAERDRTRPEFHALYREVGAPIPLTRG